MAGVDGRGVAAAGGARGRSGGLGATGAPGRGGATGGAIGGAGGAAGRGGATGAATGGAGAGAAGRGGAAGGAGGAAGIGAGTTGAAAGAATGAGAATATGVAAVGATATAAGALATAPPKSSAIDSAGPTSMMLEQTEHRARMPVAGTFTGSIRNTVRQLTQETFTIPLPRGWGCSSGEWVRKLAGALRDHRDDDRWRKPNL